MSMIDHVSIGVRDIARAKKFYDASLKPLGYTCLSESEGSLGYGAGAVKALIEDQSGVMVVFQPPDLKYVSLAESINKVRTVPTDSLFIKITQSLGICLGSEVIL